MIASFTPELTTALALFALASSITPGPNNTLLLASGANFGLRASLPHLAGVVSGFLGLIVLCGLGLAGPFATYPILHTILKWGGGAYLLYLAYRIATSSGVGLKPSGAKPMSFWQAVAFQFVNPKGWAMALGTVATYVPAKAFLTNLAIAIVIFAAINLPCCLLWTSFGLGLRRFLDRPNILRVFNLAMAGLLVVSLFPLFAELAKAR